MIDWRENYVICEHVERDAESTRRLGFRVCCEECWKRGFLNVEPLTVTTRGNLAVGQMPEGGAR